jgi:hypothetical protein
MKVKKVLKTETETYVVDCEFNQDEFDSIIEIGLNVLLAHGALPFQETETEGTYEVVPPSSLVN